MGAILLVFTVITYVVAIKWIFTDMDAVIDKVTTSLFKEERNQKLAEKASFWGWVTFFAFIINIAVMVIMIYRA